MKESFPLINLVLINKKKEIKMNKPNSKNPNLDIKTKNFLKNIDSLGKTPLYEMKPDEARAFLQEVQQIYDYKLEADVTDTEISTANADTITLRIVRPPGNKEKLPAIIYIHGGGWVMGDKVSHENLIKKLALHTKSVVIFPEYTPSPETVYPHAINQIYSIIQYIYNNPTEFNIDNSKIAIAGDSAGGNMAAAIALKSKAENGPDIKFQLLLYPVTDAKMKSDSYKEFENGPWLTKKSMEYFWNAYLNDKNHEEGIYVSPIYAEPEELKGLPPALIITNENDVLRDEGEEYGRKLTEAGVNVMNVRINGTIHDSMMLNGLSETPPVKAAFYLTCKTLKKALHNE